MFAEIEATARQIGARIPDNVVVGLDTTFFATSATVHLIGEQVPLQGETLFISAPLARILNREELASVIGHELGHFSGWDTAYSLRFAPVYAGLGSSLQAVSTANDEGALGLAKLPALALLGYVHGLFQESEAGVSRERELAADQSGAKAGSALALASALCKICVYSELWGKVQSQNVAALAEGQITRNLSRAFADSARYDVEAASADKLLEEVLDARVAHPTDSHPPVSQRLDALQVSVAQVRDVGLSLPAQPAIELFESGGEELECSLTELHHRVLVAVLGPAPPPLPPPQTLEEAIDSRRRPSNAYAPSCWRSARCSAACPRYCSTSDDDDGVMHAEVAHAASRWIDGAAAEGRIDELQKICGNERFRGNVEC